MQLFFDAMMSIISAPAQQNSVTRVSSYVIITYQTPQHTSGEYESIFCKPYILFPMD
jgi:hypothetical protein